MMRHLEAMVKMTTRNDSCQLEFSLRLSRRHELYNKITSYHA